MELILKCAECDALLDGDINSKGELVVNLCSKCKKEIEELTRDQAGLLTEKHIMKAMEMQKMSMENKP